MADGPVNQSLQSGDFKAPSVSESYLAQILEEQQRILRELRIMNHLLAQNGAPFSEDLDTLRNDPAFNEVKVGS